MGIFKFLGNTFSRKKEQSTNLLTCACREVTEEPKTYQFTQSVPLQAKVECNCGVGCACGGQCTFQDK